LQRTRLPLTGKGCFIFFRFFQNAVQALCNGFPLSFDNYCQNFYQKVFFPLPTAAADIFTKRIFTMRLLF